MRSILKSGVQSGLRSIGYELRCTRYIAPAMLNANDVLRLDFTAAICRLMHQLDRQQLCFLQVGAFDGVSCDPLHPFVLRYNWKGVLVEPQPSAYAKLAENYRAQSELVLRNCAIAQSRGEVPLYTVAGEGLPDWCGGLASFSRASIEKHEPFAPGISKRIVQLSVPTETFDDLLSQLPGEELDLLQIDTEGFDAELIAMFPFAKFRPKIIHFERKHLSVKQLDNCLKSLQGLGYKFAFDGEEDMLACLTLDS